MDYSRQDIFTHDTAACILCYLTCNLAICGNQTYFGTITTYLLVGSEGHVSFSNYLYAPFEIVKILTKTTQNVCKLLTLVQEIKEYCYKQHYCSFNPLLKTLLIFLICPIKYIDDFLYYHSAMLNALWKCIHLKEHYWLAI